MWSNHSLLFSFALFLLPTSPAMATDSTQLITDARNNPLPYVPALQQRDPDSINGVVIHATELPDLATAREYGERVLYKSGSGNSGHIYIDRDGSVEIWVPLDRVAHHVADHNELTIGIELVNRGRYPHWLASHAQDWTDAYPESQIDALIRVLDELQSQLPGLKWVAGHAQLDSRQVTASDDPALTVRRKLDPGATFPWQKVLQATGLPRKD